MKTRIISAAVGIVLLAAAIAVGVHIPLVMCIAFSLLCMIGTYEMLKNTGFVKSSEMLTAALVFSFVDPFLTTGIIHFDEKYIILLYYLVLAVITVACHKNVDAVTLLSAAIVPTVLSMCFSALYTLFAVNGAALFYFVAVLLFAWGSDTAAYFGGTFFGKHKLAPEISPKKTVEGAVCGVFGSVLLSVVAWVIYKRVDAVNITIVTVIFSATVFSVFGMLGDLLTSQIKRRVGIKDFGNIMPGHGGVMDRFDSVLFIAPFFKAFLELKNVI